MKRGQGTVTDDSANAVKNEAAALIQLSLFNAVQPIPMNTNPTDIDQNEPDDAYRNEATCNAEPSMESIEQGKESSSLGLRLRHARSARELSVEDVAHQLKLPHTVIEALEAERFDRIGHGIFLRGYLSKYLQLLDLPQELAAGVLDDREVLPPLVTSGMVSRPRYLFDRYSGSALYLILTGVIIVPAVLLAMHVGLDARISRIAPLDAPVAGAQLTPAIGSATHLEQVPEKAMSGHDSSTVAGSPNLPAVMASMASFSATQLKPAAAPEPQDSAPTKIAEAAAPAVGLHSLHLQLVEPSWVEVVDGSGKQLEYSLLPAGTARDYESKNSLNVLLGNAAGASIRVDGEPRDLAPYLRGNVARFKLSEGDWKVALPNSG